MQRLVLVAILAGRALSQDLALKPSAAQLRRYEHSEDCTGDFSVLNTDVLDECTPYLIPAPASILTKQINDTAYASYHYQGVQDCSGTNGTHLIDLVVNSCVNVGGYSQMRVWVMTPPAPKGACAAPGKCGRAYQACCAGFGATGNACTCHLHNGTGKAGARDCGKCGKAFVGCCSAFALTGNQCTCDIKDQAAMVI